MSLWVVADSERLAISMLIAWPCVWKLKRSFLSDQRKGAGDFRN
jgi:hypothetical protein